MQFPRWLLILTHVVFDSGWSQESSLDEDGSSRLPFRPIQLQNIPVAPGDTSSSHQQQHYPQLLLPGHTRVGNNVAIPDPNMEPEFLTNSQELEVVLGDTVVLPCKVAHLGDSIVLWKQGERVISAGPIQVRKDFRFTLVEAASLRITGVDVADTGNYTCEVEWRGTPMQIVHKLVVLVPPSIEAVLPGGMGQVDRPIEAREGGNVRLECRADGIPPPIIRWRRPNGEYGATRRPRGPVLDIDNVKKEDAGTYICTASNNVGTISADQIELRVLYPPEVSSAERTVYSGPGGRADLTCVVKAEPRANVTWYRDGQRVKYDRRHIVEEHGSLVMLRLKDINVLDLGNYSCEAENTQGTARDHIELSGKPEVATINSSPEGLYRNSYNLTWTVRSIEPLTKVRLLFRKMDQPTNYNHNGTWSNLMLSMPTVWHDPMQPEWARRAREYHVHSHLFQNLAAESRYEVIVQSKNQFGWSEPTKSFIFSTRYRDYSPLNMASHPSLRGGLVSSSDRLVMPTFQLWLAFLILILIQQCTSLPTTMTRRRMVANPVL